MNPLETVLEKVGRVLSDQFGIKVVCEGQRCHTNGRTIYLPALPDDVPEELWNTIRGYIDHESGHIGASSDFAAGAEFKKKHGPAGFGFMNCLEDLRTEEYMKRRYPGSVVNLDNAYRYAVRVTAEKLENGEPLPPDKHLGFAVYSRAQGEPDLPFIDPAAYELADKIDREIRGAVTAPDTAAVVQLAETAWPVVRDYLSQPSVNDSGSGDPADADSGSSSNSSSSSSNSDDPAPSGNTSTPGQGQSNRRRKKWNTSAAGSSTTDSASPGSAENAGNLGVTTVGVAGDADANDSGGALGIIGGLAEDIAGAVQRHATAAGAYRPWTTANDTITFPPNHSTTSHADRLAPLMPHVAGVRQRLIQTLMAEVRAHWLPEQEAGRLNPRTLHRLAATRHLRRPGAEWQEHAGQQGALEAPSTGANAFARRLFRKRVVAKRLQTAVTLLVDLSHSMRGSKLDIARDTALVLCEALSRLNIPVAVWGFSTEHHGKLLQDTAKATGIPTEQLDKQYRFAPLIHERFKNFDESFRAVSGRFEQMRTYFMTPLGESMLFAARDLLKRRDERKVLLVLTDGKPAVGMGNDIVTFNHARDAILRIERAGMDICLVGIVEQCVLNLHHRSVVVEQLADLPRTVMAEMQKLLAHDSRAARRVDRKAA